MSLTCNILMKTIGKISQFLKFLCSKNLVVLRRKYDYLDYDASNCSLSNTKDKLRVLKEH